MLEEFASFIVSKLPVADIGLKNGLHFFIEEGIVIFGLLYFVVFTMSFFKDRLSSSKIKEYLSSSNPALAYASALALGSITPFCSCSSIPLLIGFVYAGIPLHLITVFLLASSTLSPIIIGLLLSFNGLGTASLYVLSGGIISILGGWLCQKFNLQKLLSLQELKFYNHSCSCGCCKSAHIFAANIIKHTWAYILIGLIIGSLMQGYISEEMIIKYAGRDNVFAIPLAVLIGVGLYAPHGASIPIFMALLEKNVPLGTALVMLVSINTISLPEIIMLKNALNTKLLSLFIGFLVLSLIIVGYLLNYI